VLRRIVDLVHASPASDLPDPADRLVIGTAG